MPATANPTHLKCHTEASASRARRFSLEFSITTARPTVTSSSSAVERPGPTPGVGGVRGAGRPVVKKLARRGGRRAAGRLLAAPGYQTIVRLDQAIAEYLDHGQAKLRLFRQRGEELLFGQDAEEAVGGRDHRGCPRTLREERHLAEVVLRPELGQHDALAPAATEDADAPRQHDE